jgi:hypothetical protein
MSTKRRRMRIGLDFMISEEPVFSSFLGAGVVRGELGLGPPGPGFGLHSACVVVGDCVTYSQYPESHNGLAKSRKALLATGSVILNSGAAAMPFPVPNKPHGQGVGSSPSLHVRSFAKASEPTTIQTKTSTEIIGPKEIQSRR